MKDKVINVKMTVSISESSSKTLNDIEREIRETVDNHTFTCLVEEISADSDAA